MAALPPKPRYYILPVHLPWPYLVRMDDLNERESTRASETYSSTISTTRNGEALRRNLTKLIMARFGEVDMSKYRLITRRADANDRRESSRQIQAWAETYQTSWIATSWIATSSWIQKYIAGAVIWSDYQVLLNNFNRHIKLLEFAPAGETAGARTARRRRARAYKKALRIHHEHIHTGAAAIIQEAQKNATDALANGPSEVKQLELQKVASFLRRYQNGLQATNT
ncbi:hypothetical protein FB567DRAFT_589729 [Paraphoma chrysanthemicola]|uniref:Uncharacterized protein n=1 Tax=Paraphoma chrysanthemicola TaxID=798071 RepID=A0A8K0W1A4_9PLEO|nr:hypothetical protein FB567DRAFT_589729 [Paraphoma chrysanthemicola]